MWLESLEGKILTKEIDFDLSGKLIDLNLDDGKMEIHFSESLFPMIREYR